MALLISPAAGVFFYNPPLLLCVSGMWSWYRSQGLFCLVLSAAMAVFVLFICSLTFFKGDTSWGPRYLTPVFAVLWILAPAGFRLMRRWVAVALLAAGLLVQVGARHRPPPALHGEKDYRGRSTCPPPNSTSTRLSHTCSTAPVRSRRFSRPATRTPSTTCHLIAPTFPSYIFLDVSGNLYSGVRDSDVIDSLRPWWASLRRLDARARPVDIGRTAALLLLVSAAGLILMILGARGQPTLVSVDWSGAGTPANSGG